MNVVFSISDLNKYVKAVLANDEQLTNISVRGEIINLKKYASAYYFTLKEQDNARIAAVIFNISGFAPGLKDGDEVIATGRVTLYEKSGTYQIVTHSVSYYGLGAKLVALQKLKEKLEKTGIFDQIHKRKLPKFPHRIGIIAPKDSAALADLVENIRRRYPLVKLVVVSATFQGDDAPLSLISAYERLIKHPLDLFILARGGGSSDDLWAFNDERLILALANRPIPFISAIGHEIDTTLVDYLADVRASTPTAAAELAVPDRNELTQTIIDYETRIKSNLIRHLEKYELQLTNLRSRPVLQNYQNILNTITENITNLNTKIHSLFKIMIQDHMQKLSTLENKLSEGGVKLLKSRGETLLFYEAKLHSLNPEHVLKRGYAFITKEKHVIKSKSEVSTGDKINIQFIDGKIVAIVEE